MTDEITIRTDYPVSISTSRPVSISTEGGVTTVTIGAAATAPVPSGLVEIPRDDPAGALLPYQPPGSDRPRCGHWMVRSKQPCARAQGHKGNHLTRAQIEAKQEYNRNRAKNLYATDPKFAEAAKARSREAWAREHPKDEGGE